MKLVCAELPIKCCLPNHYIPLNFADVSFAPQSQSLELSRRTPKSGQH